MAREGMGLSLLCGSFRFFTLCNLQTPMILYHRLFSHSSVPTHCCREIWSSSVMGDMILLPHPAVADMMVCALPQPAVTFQSVVPWVRWVLTCCFSWRHKFYCDGTFCAKVASGDNHCTLTWTVDTEEILHFWSSHMLSACRNSPSH